MKPEQENKPEEYNIEVHVEIPDEGDAPEKPRRLIPTWGWAIVLVGALAFLLADTDFGGLVYFLVSALVFIAFCMLLSRAIP